MTDRIRLWADPGPTPGSSAVQAPGDPAGGELPPGLGVRRHSCLTPFCPDGAPGLSLSSPAALATRVSGPLQEAPAGLGVGFECREPPPATHGARISLWPVPLVMQSAPIPCVLWAKL